MSADEIQQMLFWLYSGVLLVSALRVITAKNPVHAVLFLVLCFVTCAAIWLLLEAEFLAIVLVLVYVGAVMVLLLFVVMMLDIDIEPLRAGFTSHLPLGIVVGAVMVLEMGLVLSRDFFAEGAFPMPESAPAEYSNTGELGRLLYGEYLFQFEIAALILLVAIVAAIALTLRRRDGVRRQNIAEQHAVTKADRLRIVQMPSARQSQKSVGEGE
jgi:NADH-quinone oxidoreductase subunit J